MHAFLKRRWILLSCATFLLASSVFNFEKVFYCEDYDLSFALLDSGNFSIVRVNLPKFSRDEGFSISLVERPPGCHSPKFGGKPAYVEDSPWAGMRTVSLTIPIWLLLGFVNALLAYREFRWRNKPAKTATLPT